MPVHGVTMTSTPPYWRYNKDIQHTAAVERRMLTNYLLGEKVASTVVKFPQLLFTLSIPYTSNMAARYDCTSLPFVWPTCVYFVRNLRFFCSCCFTMNVLLYSCGYVMFCDRPKILKFEIRCSTKMSCWNRRKLSILSGTTRTLAKLATAMAAELLTSRVNMLRKKTWPTVQGGPKK